MRMRMCVCVDVCMVVSVPLRLCQNLFALHARALTGANLHMRTCIGSKIQDELEYIYP